MAAVLSAVLLPVGIGLGLSIALGRTASGPRVGGVAQDFELPVVFGRGRSFRLAEQRGTPVVAEVFAGWCEYCRDSAPVLADAARATRAGEVTFVGISVDDLGAEAQAAAHLWGLPYDVVWDDGRVEYAWNISALPTVVVIDGNGEVRHVAAGTPDPAELEQWISDVGAPRRDLRVF